MSLLSDSKRSIVALALIFCSGGSLLFAQEKSAAPTTDQTKELLERAVAQAESTAAISHQLKDIFQRAAKAVVKIHGVDEHSEIAAPDFSLTRPARFTPHTQLEAKREISRSNSAVKNIRRVSFWRTSAAGQPC